MNMRTRILGLIFPLLALSAPITKPDDYAATSAWQFKNFKTKEYGWDIYRDTFIGIPPSEDPWSSAFDVLFYNQLYKSKLSKSGNCYGMSLLSLMILKNGGHLGYCAPIPQYSGDIFGTMTLPNGDDAGPSDPMLRRAINIMHGHQVNLPTLQYILDIIAQNANRNGSFAYNRFVTLQMQNDLTLVSVTKTLNPDDGGHTMVAYRAQDFGGGNRRLYLYDPNRTWADPMSRTWYQTEQNFIQISGNSWSFDHGDGIWSGDPASGGNLIIIPISVTGPHSRSPASLGLQIIGKILTTLLVSGDSVKVEQVTDAEGKRLFNPGTHEVDTDPATGMKDMFLWYPSDEGSSTTKGERVLFKLGSSGGTLKVYLTSSDSGYTLRSLDARNQVSITARGGRGTDAITFHHAGGAAARVSLENGRGTGEYDVQFVQATQPRARLQVLTSSRMQIPEGSTVELALTNQDRALSVSSPIAPVQYDLEMKTITRYGETSLDRRGIVQAAGTVQTVQPQDWLNLQKSEILERRTSLGQ
jgi:hypothetical protein